jgi:hypothetical protein
MYLDLIYVIPSLSLLLPLYDVCLAEKQEMLILSSLF